jgi:hypothetical protein
MTEQHPDFTLYSIDNKHIFYTDKKVWTLDELHNMVVMLKHYIQDEDTKELQRLGRYDMLGLNRVETWTGRKNEGE